MKLKKERNLTSIVVTHDVHGAKSFADRVVLLREGKVVIDGALPAAGTEPGSVRRPIPEGRGLGRRYVASISAWFVHCRRLAVLVAGVFLIGSGESLFQSTYRVKADFQNVAGLADGAGRAGGRAASRHRKTYPASQSAGRKSDRHHGS